MDRNDLEQAAHRILRGEALECPFDFIRTFRIGARQRLRSRFNAKTKQPVALRSYPRHRRARRHSSPFDRLEIDVRRQVLFSRAIEQWSEGVAANRLQRIAGSALRMAV